MREGGAVCFRSITGSAFRYWVLDLLTVFALVVVLLELMREGGAICFRSIIGSSMDLRTPVALRTRVFLSV